MLSVFGGVSGKGSLAKERNSSTFLPNLVRTTLACFLLRVPYEDTPERKTDRVDEKHAKSPGLECLWHSSCAGAVRYPARPWKAASPLC